MTKTLVFALATCTFCAAEVPANGGVRALPNGPLIVGYANWAECDDKIVQGVKDGVNVVIWFATNLGFNKTSMQPTIRGGPNHTCVG
jgi:hypothetical protein